MSNSIFGQGFATVSDYPAGLMNTCQCGQVVKKLNKIKIN